MSQNKISTEMKKTLGLVGITMNAMAFIAPGAFLWITYQVQAAQINPSGVSTVLDMWFGLVVALVLSFFTAGSYALLVKRYPDAGTGSSYYFADKVLRDRGSGYLTRRVTKFAVGWMSHLYYWIYPGVMVAFNAILITFILQTFGFSVTIVQEIVIAVAFAFLSGFIAYHGINGSTKTNTILNFVQLIMLGGVTILALIYRFVNPQNVVFLFPNLSSIVLPHDINHALFQATIAILLLVGFESTTTLAAEAKKSSDMSRGMILSLIIQGVFAYLFAYFGVQAWINNSYTIVINGKTFSGFAAAAQSSAPIGDMIRNLGDILLSGHGLELMLIAAGAVAAAILGTTLSCLNTGIRITYAMACENEMPRLFRRLHERYAIPHGGIVALTAVSMVIGAFGVLSVRNLTAVALISNIGTFLLYGLTNIIAFVSLVREHSSAFLRKIVPIFGAAANIAMLLAIVWLGILGGGDTQFAAFFALVTTGIWGLLGTIYFIANSITEPSILLPFSEKEYLIQMIRERG